MTAPLKQHLIDPEVCIRCYTCEMSCPENAIEHDDNNVVVNADLCNFCMDCIPVCPTGSIDEWRVVKDPYSLEEQYSWEELPEQEELSGDAVDTNVEALDEAMAALLAEAHAGAGGKSKAPATAAKPTINLYNLGKPVEAVVQGNYRLTEDGSGADVRHIVLDFQGHPMPVLEGQSVGIIAPGEDENGNTHLPRLYSVSSPRDGERSGYNNVSLTVKREEGGLCSNYICDLQKGDTVRVTGPFGATFLLPDDPEARIMMICTGTGSAPMRAFTMRRQRTAASNAASMLMFFGARTPETLPYHGPLKKVPDDLLIQHLVYSRAEDGVREYVQDRMLSEPAQVLEVLRDPKGYVYICGLKGMEEGVEAALTSIAQAADMDWGALRDEMRADGRYHVETY